MKILALFLAALALAACESDFVTDPTRPRPTRALEDPFARGSANSEVMSGPTGAIPLVTVVMPNTKDEQPVVHTIAEPLATLGQRPATQPATQPATRASPEEGPPASTKDEIKVVAQQKPADVISITRDNEANADVWILSPTGIGSVTLERNGENWPAVMRVHLRYDQARAFNTLEGFNAYELSGQDRRLSLKTTTDKPTGKAEIAIPAFARSPRILIEWVDANR